MSERVPCRLGKGQLVRVKRLEDARRDLLYSGFVGRIERFRGEYPDAEAWVDTDGYKKTQSVTFRGWFRLDELELPALPHESKDVS